MTWVEENMSMLVASVIGLLAIVAAVGVAIWQHKPKRLDYKIVNNVELLSDHARGLGSRLEVLFQQNPIKEPRLVTVRVKNTGKKAVEASEYAQGIEVHYDKNPPFEAFVADQSAPGIVNAVYSGTGDIYGDRVDIRPQLMTSGDWFNVQLLSDGPSGAVTVSCRFKDQTRPMRKYSDAGSTKGDLLAFGVAIFVGLTGPRKSRVSAVQGACDGSFGVACVVA